MRGRAPAAANRVVAAMLPSPPPPRGGALAAGGPIVPGHRGPCQPAAGLEIVPPRFRPGQAGEKQKQGEAEIQIPVTLCRSRQKSASRRRAADTTRRRALGLPRPPEIKPVTTMMIVQEAANSTTIDPRSPIKQLAVKFLTTAHESLVFRDRVEHLQALRDAHTPGSPRLAVRTITRAAAWSDLGNS